MSLIATLLTQIDPLTAGLVATLWLRIEKTILPRINRLEAVFFDSEEEVRSE